MAICLLLYKLVFQKRLTKTGKFTKKRSKHVRSVPRKFLCVKTCCYAVGILVIAGRGECICTNDIEPVLRKQSFQEQ